MKCWTHWKVYDYASFGSVDGLDLLGLCSETDLDEVFEENAIISDFVQNVPFFERNLPIFNC